MATVIVGAIVFCCLGLAARSVYKSKKSGSSCGSCSGCDKSDSGCCH